MSETEEGIDRGTAEIILVVVVVVVVLWAVASLRCWYGDGGGGQQQSETADKDGNMVVLDGAQLALSVAQLQPGCCCGDGDGDGGSCGGFGGD